MNTEIQTQQQDNSTLAFPIAGTPRFQLDASGMKWRDYRKAAGIDDKSPMDKVKAAQKEFKAQQKQAFKQAKQLAGLLINDDSFRQVKLTCHTDKKGYRVFSVRGTTKALKVPKALADEAEKPVSEMSVEELEAIIAERKAVVTVEAA